MAYIGNTPALQYISMAKQTFTADSSTTSFVLDQSVANENELEVFVNNVRQEPGSGKAYTASGTTLTMSEAPTAGDEFYCIFQGKATQTVTPGSSTVTSSMLVDSAVTTAKINDSAVTSAKLSGVTQGITQADMFRLTTDITATNADITANLERVDDASFGRIGTGMTEASGIFTFPETGIYQVTAEGTFVNSGSTETSMDILIHVTQNNSTYDAVANIQNGVQSTSSAFQSGIKSCLVDVTDTSNVKVKFATDSLSSGSSLKGDTDVNKTTFTFIRLGDT